MMTNNFWKCKILIYQKVRCRCCKLLCRFLWVWKILYCFRVRFTSFFACWCWWQHVRGLEL